MARRRSGRSSARSGGRKKAGGSYSDRARERQEQVKSRAGRQTSVFTPDEGENRVRIIPPTDPDSLDFYLETRGHWWKGQDEQSHFTICNTHEEEGDCFFCALSTELSASDDAREREEGEDLSDRPRVLIPVLVRGQESDGVKMFGCSLTMLARMMGYFADPDYGKCADVDDGRDFIITRTGKGRNNTSYDVRAAGKTSSFGPTELLEDCITVEGLLEKYSLTYDEMRAAYEDNVFPDRNGDAGSKKKRGKTKSKEEPPEDEEDEDDNPLDTPPCFGQYDRKDPECRTCPDRKACASDSDEEDEDEEEEEKPEPTRRRRKATGRRRTRTDKSERRASRATSRRTTGSKRKSRR